MLKFILFLFFVPLTKTIYSNNNLKPYGNYNSNGQYPCIICRSPGVENYPELFLLPKNQIMNLPLLDNCDNPSSLPNSSFFVNCDKYCTNIAIECPDSTACTNKYLYIRGCQNILTQNIQPSITDNDLDKNYQYCEYDSNFLAFKSNGNPVNIEYIASLCLSNIQDPNEKIPCNNYLSNGSKYSISLLKNSCNVLRPSGSFGCYKCQEEERNCHTGSDGSQAYCFKRYMKVGDNKYYIAKGSSNVNPYFTNSSCYDDSTSYSLSPFINVQARSGVCFCSDKNYCNSSENIKNAFLKVTIFVIFSLLL
uniref:Uncharacterized protein n=1 Tax=Strongyloides venezuelensis TaxID=75913 RepID=A0A0K0FQR7_STRVS